MAQGREDGGARQGYGRKEADIEIVENGNTYLPYHGILLRR